MRRQFIWMQAALCAVTFSVAAPVLAGTDNGQPPPHAQAHGTKKAKKAKKAPKDAKHAQDRHHEGRHDESRHDEGRHVHPRDWDARFHGLDRNGDNIISRAEWKGDDRSFANHDWNHDGKLFDEELRAGATRPAAARDTSPRRSRPRTESDEVLFARMDTNRDNSLSRSEWTGSASEFTRLDFNRDGVLSPYEFGVGR